MKKRFLLLGFAFLILEFQYAFSPSLCNHSQGSSEILSLDNCIDMALNNNLEIKEKEKNIKQSKADLVDSRSGYYPKIDFTKSYTSAKFVTYTPTYTFEMVPGTPPKYKLVEGEMVRKDISKDTYKAGISLKQLIYDSGKTKSLVNRTSANLNFAELEYERIKKEIIFKVKKNYISVLKAKRILELSKENLNSSLKHLEMIKAKERLGLVTYQEVLNIESEVQNNELNLITAKNSYEFAKSSLNSIIGRDIQEDIELKDLDDCDFNMNFDECLNSAYKNRIELKQMELQIESGLATLKLAKSERYPIISATGSFDYQDEKYPPEETTWNIGVLFSIPLFDGGSRSSKIDSARAVLEGRRIQLEKTKQSIELEVKETYQKFIESKERLKATELHLRQIEENLKMIEKMYGLGMANIIELIDARFLFHQGNTNYINAKYDFYISIAYLEKVIGR